MYYNSSRKKSILLRKFKIAKAYPRTANYPNIRKAVLVSHHEATIWGIKMVGLFFVKPGSKNFDIIKKDFSTISSKSGNNIDFFFAGYYKEGRIISSRPVERSECPAFVSGSEKWFFDDNLFDSIVTALESETSWSYKLKDTFLLINTSQTETSFNDVISIDLDTVVSNKTFDSVGGLISDIISYTKTKHNFVSPTKGYFKRIWNKAIMKSFIDIPTIKGMFSLVYAPFTVAIAKFSSSGNVISGFHIQQIFNNQVMINLS